jgi:hypothetical protein
MAKPGTEMVFQGLYAQGVINPSFLTGYVAYLFVADSPDNCSYSPVL